MNRPYRLGLILVLGTLSLAAVICSAAAVVRRDRAIPAGEDFGEAPLPLGKFSLVKPPGEKVSDADLANRVWVAAFIFTRCPSSCPRITAVMKGLQDRLADTNARLVSVSVDPDFDTPEVLGSYARRMGADPSRWLFLTGPKDDVYSLILDRFKLSVAEIKAEDRKPEAEAVSHSNRLVLIDRGNREVGAFDSTDPEAVVRLEAAVRRLEKKHRNEDLGWPLRLPSVNASLNATCAVLLIIGWSLIRAGKVRPHAACMIASLAVSSLFLGSYLVYHYFVGSVPFRGVGPIRLVYFTILLSHTVLAVAVVPLVTITLIRAVKGRFSEHARIARVTFPIWLYVSITGVVVYWMLYQMELPGSTL